MTCEDKTVGAVLLTVLTTVYVLYTAWIFGSVWVDDSYWLTAWIVFDSYWMFAIPASILVILFGSAGMICGWTMMVGKG